MASLDEILHVGHAAPTRLLFQVVRLDEAIGRSDAPTFFDAASKPTPFKWYDAGHKMDGYRKSQKIAPSS
jgi:hypothetical protein